ncbi:MAG: exodeoxyribonuclease III [Ignavibacteria bacterium]|nr:exodeoxyribonuclease III [Ignavibacteria bacterium]
MKIVTWNVNGYRSIVGQNPSKRYDKVTRENKLFNFIQRFEPEIICLQEIKADLEQIDNELQSPLGYIPFYNTCKSKKGYSGVATFTKIQPNDVKFEIGIPEFDQEGRFIQLDFEKFILFNIYFPKGYTDHERLDFKMEFYEAIYNYIRRIEKSLENIIISGDFNTAHTEIDLARPKENINTSGFLPIERKKLDELIDMGFVDAFRLFTKEGGHYSWWSQRGRARENNVGWRVDYHFVNRPMVPFVTNCYMLPNEMGSDHCPVVLEISDNLIK